MAIWAKNYVGDRIITGLKVHKLKKRYSYQENDAT